MPVPNYQFATVASGNKFVVGIDADGFLHAWGCNPFVPGPTPGGTFTYVGAGEGYYVALRSSPGGFHTPVHVGDIGAGQFEGFPSGALTFKAISVGEYHTIGIIKSAEIQGYEEDSLYIWGSFPVEQQYPFTSPAPARFALPAPYNAMPIWQLKFKFVEAVAYNSAGILHYPEIPELDGRMIVWGNDSPYPVSRKLVTDAPNDPSFKFKYIALGHRHGLAIRTATPTHPDAEGLLMVWCDPDTYNNKQVPAGRYISAMGGYQHSSAVNTYSEVKTWGGNECTPDPAPSGNNFVAVGLGESSQMTIARTQGVSCYANCDGSTTPPVLTANDFFCFTNRFAANDPYCDCDGVGGITANDYQCFADKYANGCGM